jgi:hypothetical protein
MEQSSKAKNGNENICSNSASVVLLLTTVNYLINGLGFFEEKGTSKIIHTTKKGLLRSS